MGPRFRSLVAAGLIALAGVGCKGGLANGDAGDEAGAASALACTAATDCTRSEIDHEILSAADCICLLGCPFHIMNKTTANRRMAQYQALCTPGRNAQGQPCPIDDCAQPALLECSQNMCIPAGLLRE